MSTNETSTIRFDRLKILADHLMNGELGHQNFHFWQYNSSDTNKCGTFGCAIGECPIVFPKEWEFDRTGDPVLKGSYVTISSGMKFFGISSFQYCHLFIPDDQDTTMFGGQYLDESATREQVAANIYAFIEKMQKP